MMDLNDANEQRPDGIIPDGTFVKVLAHIRAGGVDGEHPDDKSLLKASQSSSAQMLDFEFTVLHGPHAKRKLWQLMTVSGGKVDEKGVSKAWNITKDTLAAIVNSAFSLHPQDMSEAAKAKRRVPSFKCFDGLQFVIKVGVEFGDGQYPDKNKIARVMVPSDPEWQVVMQGGEAPAKPTSRARSNRVTPATPPTAAWQQPALPAASAWGQPAAQQSAAPAPAPGDGPQWLNG